MTNDLYDSEVYKMSEPEEAENVWLIAFTKGIYSENPYDTMASINEILYKALIEFSKTA